MRPRVALAGAAATTVALAVTPSLASAHGLVGKQDLPIPRWLFVWGASAVLVISFIALATLWPRPVMQEPEQGRRVLRLPGWLEAVSGAVGIAAFAAVVYAGFAGTQTATDNLAPTVIYVVFWVGVPVASLLFGDVFRAINPWRATARAIAWATGRVLRGDAPEDEP